MRRLVSLPQQTHAERFTAALIDAGIDAHAENDDGAWDIWVENEELLDEAKRLLVEFQENPDDQRYIEAVRRAERKLAQQLKAERRRNEQVVDVRTQGGSRSQVLPVITLGLVMVSVVLAFMKEFDPGRWEAVANILWFAPFTFQTFELWRVFTPVLLHGDLIHLLFNMMWMMSLGKMIETQHGMRFYGMLVILCACISNCAQFFIVSPHFLGMSGVVFGLAAYCWYVGKKMPQKGIILDGQNALFMLLWMILCFTGLVGNIANMAHLFGALTGLAIAFIEVKLARR